MSVFARLFRKSGRPKGSQHAHRSPASRSSRNRSGRARTAIWTIRPPARAAVASTKSGQVSVAASAQESAFGLDDSGTWESDRRLPRRLTAIVSVSPDADEISAPNPCRWRTRPRPRATSRN